MIFQLYFLCFEQAILQTVNPLKLLGLLSLTAPLKEASVSRISDSKCSNCSSKSFLKDDKSKSRLLICLTFLLINAFLLKEIFNPFELTDFTDIFFTDHQGRIS